MVFNRFQLFHIGPVLAESGRQRGFTHSAVT